MFHAGQEINSSLGKKYPFHFGQRFSDVLKCCIWFLFTYGCWHFSAEALVLPQWSDVYCCLIFKVFLIRHAVFAAKNLPVVSFFTQASKLNAQNETKLSRRSFLVSLAWGSYVLTPHQKSRHRDYLDVSSHDVKRCCQRDSPRLQLVIYSLPVPRPNKIWQAFTSGMKVYHRGASKVCASGQRCLAYVMLRCYCTIYKANPLCPR